MLKHIVVLAASLTCATAAHAQQQQQQATSPPPPGAAISPLPAPAATADTRKLIGRKIQDAQNETIGQITSIYIGPDPRVMVGVGGFLGLGEREVRIAWSDLHVENYGEKVMVNMTRDELKARPEYKYGDTSWRGQVFSDKGPWPVADPDRSASAADRMPNNGVAIGGKTASDRNSGAATASTGDFNAAGEMSGAALIGATIQNENQETVGKVRDIYVDGDGAIRKVVVSVGGFLGMGAKDVAVNWSDIRFSRDDKSVVLTTSWTRDSLKGMPDYKYERRVPPAAKSGG
jgi:sporulation protein YlmC with PRC-barrel domain